MSERYTIEEADALIPEVAERMARLAALQRRAATGLGEARRRARRNGHRGGLEAEVAGEMGTLLAWLEENHLVVKGMSPPLVDFPAQYGARCAAVLDRGRRAHRLVPPSRRRFRREEAGGGVAGLTATVPVGPVVGPAQPPDGAGGRAAARPPLRSRTAARSRYSI